MKYKEYRGQPVPIITIGIQYKEIWYPVEAYVDSGATYSIFSHKFSDRIGLDFKRAKLIYAQVGDGGSIPAPFNSYNYVLRQNLYTYQIKPFQW